MKKYFIKGALIAALAVAMFATYAGSANAQTAPYVSWNKYSNDCATVMIGNHTTGNGVGSACWPTSLSAQPGDTINVRIYYHNTGTAAAGNLVATLNQASTEARTSFAFTGIISGGQAQASGQAYLNLPSAQTLTLSNVAVYPDQQTTPNYVSNSSIFNGGLSLGTINPPSTCPTNNSFCHQGSIVVSYKISNTTTGTGTGTGTNTGTPCTINSITASPTQITSGSSSMLSWSTTGCSSVSISGGKISNNYPASGQVSTGALASTTSYVLTATGNGSSRTAAVTVNVKAATQTPNCAITSFNASTNSVVSGGAVTLSWNTTGCTNVTISGGNLSGSQALNGSVTTNVNTATTYTLTATAANGQTVTATQTVSVSAMPSCVIGGFYAQPAVVERGYSSTLSWNTTGGVNVTLSGGTFNNTPVYNQVTTGALYTNTTYTLTATGSNCQTSTQSVTVTVNAVQQGTAPTATTLAAQVSADGASATLNGYVNANNSGCSSSFWSNNCGTTTYYFQYGTSQYGLGNQTPVQTMNGTSGNVSAYIYGLQANTTYYFQVIATNNYGSSYGGILSFVTNNGISNVSAITTVPTNVASNTARLNGLVTGTSTGVASVYFEYGTSVALGLRTSAQVANISSFSNYFDTIFTAPLTTYYYRIVAVANGQTYTGSTVSFTTPGATVVNTNTNTNTNTTTTVVSRIGTGGGSAFLQLAITDQAQSVFPGDALNYVVTYQNISGVTLSNVVINVILPSGVTFRQTSQGVLTTNNTVAITIGTLLPVAQGTISIQAFANPTVIPGNNLVTTATAAFTLPSTAQDSAIAYDLDMVASPMANNLAGLALFGNGFFPTSLLGWILLLGLLIVLILMARYFYARTEAQRRAAVPTTTHVHYETPVSANTHTGYHGNNLPH